MSLPATVATWMLLSFFIVEYSQANVLFRFSLDFHVKQPANFSDLINKTIVVENNKMYITDETNISSTVAPTSLPTAEEQYQEAATQLLAQTKSLVQQFNQEVSPLVGRSNDLAARLKQTMRYVNEVDASLENGLYAQHVDMLRKYQSLVDNLRTPGSGSAGGVRSLEYVLLKLAMEKYELVTKQREVSEYLHRADVTWARFKDTQVIALDNSSKTETAS